MPKKLTGPRPGSRANPLRVPAPRPPCGLELANCGHEWQQVPGEHGHLILLHKRPGGNDAYPFHPQDGRGGHCAAGHLLHVEAWAVRLGQTCIAAAPAPDA